MQIRCFFFEHDQKILGGQQRVLVKPHDATEADWSA